MRSDIATTTTSRERQRSRWPRQAAGWSIRHWRRVLVALVVIAILGSAAVVTDTLGAGYAFGRVVAHVELWLNPPPDRPTLATVDVTPEPSATPDETPTLAAGTTPSPTPARVPVDVNLVTHPADVFIPETTKDWCAPAGTTIVLSILGHGTNTKAFEAQLAGQIGQWDSRHDSLDGGWGPGAIGLALAAYGVPGYQVRAYKTLDAEIKDAAIALAKTHEPVVLMAWYGAHTWVMTGYRASADPVTFPDAAIAGAYILDPWYPRISTIWGASSPPGVFHTRANLAVNILPWKRPEGLYPGRDGKFLAVVPTQLLPTALPSGVGRVTP
ncbi:MAG: hypothetical protein ACXWQ6_02065 [Candidatus Limnocylindrales bacterium]